MKLKEIASDALQSAIVETRDDSDSYEEIVILSKDLPGWNEILADKLGSPLITREEYEIVSASEDVKASQIDLALESAEKFGGIIEGQTLYYSVYESDVVLVMIWPWQDNVNVTLKKAIL